MLRSYGVEFKEIDGDLMSADIVVQDVIEHTGGNQIAII